MVTRARPSQHTDNISIRENMRTFVKVVIWMDVNIYFIEIDQIRHN